MYITYKNKKNKKNCWVSEKIAGPFDFETPRPDGPVQFLNFHKPWLTHVSGKGKNPFISN